MAPTARRFRVDGATAWAEAEDIGAANAGQRMVDRVGGKARGRRFVLRESIHGHCVDEFNDDD